MKLRGLEDLSLPFGQLPLLNIDGMNIVESTSILRYLSRKCVVPPSFSFPDISLRTRTSAWKQ